MHLRSFITDTLARCNVAKSSMHTMGFRKVASMRLELIFVHIEIAESGSRGLKVGPGAFRGSLGFIDRKTCMFS